MRRAGAASQTEGARGGLAAASGDSSCLGFQFLGLRGDKLQGAAHFPQKDHVGKTIPHVLRGSRINEHPAGTPVFEHLDEKNPFVGIVLVDADVQMSES